VSSDEDEDDEEGGDGEQKLSKKKLRKTSRLSVAELKQLVLKPEVVEVCH
jgi:splicing factor 3B subunit 2